mgnify:CR=1 FL=1
MGEGATKGTALTWLCEHLGERLADAWAFGDNINDIPMLQAAGHGMAMINADPKTARPPTPSPNTTTTTTASPAPSWPPSLSRWVVIGDVLKRLVVGDSLREKAARTVPHCRPETI